MDLTSEHYRRTTRIIFDWFAVPDDATGRLLYQRLDAAGLLLTDEKRAEVYRAGREDAARDIEAHADEHAPSDGNVQQRRLRRHLLIGARVAAPKLTLGEVADAVARGDYAACYLDEAGKPISLGRSVQREAQNTEAGQ